MPMDKLHTSHVSFLVGQVIHMAGSTAPTGFLKCNGAAVSRTTYADLFAVCGTTYGAGDGTTTFNVPDLRGEFIRGLDDGRGVDAARVLGSAQAGDMAPHGHSFTTGNQSADHSHTGTSGTESADHSHGVPQWGGGGSIYNTSQSGGYNLGGPSSGRSAGHTHTTTTGGMSASHTHSGTTANAGTTETRPRNVALLACIFAGV